VLKAVIFDLDGVLADTVSLGLNIRKKILAEHYGIDLNSVPDPQDQDHKAASTRTLLASIENHLGIHIDHDEFAQHVAEQLHGNASESLSVDPALVKFLDELKQHGIIRAVVTTGLRANANTKLDALGINQYFSIIITGGEIEHHKPHPEAYLHALEKLHLLADECVIFEDSLTGVQAGLATGCKVINFTQYNPPKEPLPGVIATVERWSDMSYNKLVSLEKTGANL